jgi:hypothetical protein
MMVKVFCPNLVEYRDIYFTKFSLTTHHIEFFIDFIFVTEEGSFFNGRCLYGCLLHVNAIKVKRFITNIFLCKKMSIQQKKITKNEVLVFGKQNFACLIKTM